MFQVDALHVSTFEDFLPPHLRADIAYGSPLSCQMKMERDSFNPREGRSSFLKEKKEREERDVGHKNSVVACFVLPGASDRGKQAV